MKTIPQDVTGDTIRRVIKDGNDPTKPMDIDFFVSALDQESAQKIAKESQKIGFVADIAFDEEESEWTCCCMKRLFLDYGGLITI